MNLWTYFKEHDEFERIMNALKNKYISLGRYSGTIELINLTECEAKGLSKFFGQKLLIGQTFKTSFSKIEKRLKNTIYEDFNWEELFTNYFGKLPKPKATIKMQKIEDEQKFFQSITQNLSEPLKQEFIKILEEKSSIQTTILKRFHKEKNFKKDLSNILDIIDHLEKLTPSTLPLIASCTGNPHFLDMITQNNSLFIKILAKYKGLEEPVTNQEKINFLSEFGIGIDDLSNYAITYMLDSDTSFIKSFKEAKEPLNINLHNIIKVDKLYTESEHVFIFENPSLLSKLLSMEVPIIITSGNPNYVVYKLLDKLTQSGTHIHYNGDFDPEGLVIANNLKRRYSGLQLFCYDDLDYYNTLSDNVLSDHRLKKLNKIENLDLKRIADLLTTKKQCGYQENNIDRIKEYITECLSNK